MHKLNLHASAEPGKASPWNAPKRSSTKAQDEGVHRSHANGAFMPDSPGTTCPPVMNNLVLRSRQGSALNKAGIGPPSSAHLLRFRWALQTPSLSGLQHSSSEAGSFLHRRYKDIKLKKHAPIHSCTKSHPSLLMLKEIKGKFLWIYNQVFAWDQ